MSGTNGTGFERTGGGKPVAQTILESLNAARAQRSDLTIDPDGAMYAENLGIARALAGAWSGNQRLANQWDPHRMTDFLPRWESILKVFPFATDTDMDRRDRIAIRFSRFAVSGTQGRLYEELQNRLGDVFVSIAYTDPVDAVVHWPGDSSDTDDLPWYSTVCRLLILVQQPTGMSDGEFYERVKAVNEVLDAISPSIITWTWYRLDSVNGVIGFYLDSSHNLDNSIFDV